MNLNDNRNFEELLRQFKPGAIPSGLETRIGRALDASSRASRRRRMASTIAWGGIIMAASVLITFGFLLFNGRLNLASGGNPAPLAAAQPAAVKSHVAGTGDAADTFTPVLAENNLQNRVDEGIVFLRNGLTARRYRYEFLDRVVWKNPATGAVVEMEIPRDEVILVPVQTY